MNLDRAFKLYDIRGPYPEVVDERLAFILGRGLSIFKQSHRVLIASDIRHSSPSLKRFLAAGFAASNVSVFDLAEVPTPQFYYSVASSNFDLGVMITASHTGEEENGFKPVTKNGLPFDEGEIMALKETLKTLTKEKAVVATSRPERLNTTATYLQAITAQLSNKSFKSRVVLDMTKSSVASVVPGLFHSLKIDYHLVKSDHQGNPLLPENRRDLEKEVRLQKADLGIMWDTDGDRVAFIDRFGTLIPMSFILGFLAQSALKLNRGKKIAVDVRAGLVVRDLVTRAGGELLIVPAWHQNLQFAMLSDPEIIFAGETTGHFLYRDFYKIDDGLLAALLFLRAFEDDGIEDQVNSLKKKYFELPEKNFACSDQIAPNVLQKLTGYYRLKGESVSLKDGLTVFGSNWRFNLRQSATEPFLRLNFESRSDSQASTIINTIQSQIDAAQKSLTHE
ncbi:MAG: Phosphomannomutase [Microgenomates group bacterium GW2011_GWA1_48_10]|uniref:Phosphomannomutase n=1 Tax=Candidatus Gottesmanbacteria bacterium RIFCSPHIGHO2_01_FULL_47_48 TaxID=1798381 RepID=A0A1F5ZZD3_9BACT|nr:MAG: Phosphomannomutase [Microgenomates group bacterium GW2011_GWA1_48_10]OGG17723.1 MAG: hypothetical protein A2721_00580 [Candidatus Gottesmanbacteria bacterium RIFCSPHIGHO2_01_FULL_47_48]